jgi:hypothetical protein
MYDADLARIHHEGFGFVARNSARALLEALAQAGLTHGARGRAVERRARGVPGRRCADT